MIILGDFSITLPVPTTNEISIAVGVIVLLLIAVGFFIVKKHN
ncbi:MAG TPA: hypothetical protein VNV43_07255 [Candidatus Acidoferrales bacterium]|jgi:hypothetical protein|nr:hypothetical protein [Candidatus Acidoferrales bacterium]